MTTVPRCHRGDGLSVWWCGRWARVLIAFAAGTPPGSASGRLYLADPVDHLRITAVLAYEDESCWSAWPLISISSWPVHWPVVADVNARARLDRWLEDVT